MRGVGLSELGVHQHKRQQLAAPKLDGRDELLVQLRS